MVRLKGALAFAALALMSGCVSPPKFSTTTRTADSDSLKFDRVYVYSFLDVRESSLGKDFAGSFENRLKQRLADAGVRSEFLWFKRSPVEATYALKATQTGRGGTSTQIPIGEVIRENADAERTFNASHRLIIFPANVVYSAGGQDFDITWNVLERNGRLVWGTKSKVHEFNYYGLGVNGDDRATAMVDGFIAEVKANGFLPK